MDSVTTGSKRKREDGSGSWSKHSSNRTHNSGSEYREGRTQGRKNWGNDQVKLNQIQENERMREWVAQEDDFVLRQAKKKAEIRVREGRANPIDWLAVTLKPIDPTRGVLDDEVKEADLEFMHPDSVFDTLSEKELGDLRKDIDTYLKLETNSKNRDYWKTMHIICKDRQRKLRRAGPEGRAMGSVSSDIDRLLAPKTYEELQKLEDQIKNKLDSNEPIDTDYWQQLLDSLLVYKAKSKVKKLYQSVIESRLNVLQRESESRANLAVKTLNKSSNTNIPSFGYQPILDPAPLLQIDSTDKGLEVVNEAAFLRQIAKDRQRISKMGYVPAPKGYDSRSTAGNVEVDAQDSQLIVPSREMTTTSNARSRNTMSTNALYDKEVAKGVGEDEEVFAGEEQVETRNKDQWTGTYQPRKPKYFNRVQMGYEWNKYNQTHYDHDNPPPKVVQGYKFHVFYPDLIDVTKAPTFKIIREGGRRKGQSIAPAGEEDTCIIRFMAGPPYEDVAFRIVDRDWDYSAKHDRGFKSTFENGILTLHFSFKKVFYRK